MSTSLELGCKKPVKKSGPVPNYIDEFHCSFIANEAGIYPSSRRFVVLLVVLYILAQNLETMSLISELVNVVWRLLDCVCKMRVLGPET